MFLRQKTDTGLAESQIDDALFEEVKIFDLSLEHSVRTCPDNAAVFIKNHQRLLENNAIHDW